jgi:hypothetical protein
MGGWSTEKPIPLRPFSTVRLVLRRLRVTSPDFILSTVCHFLLLKWAWPLERCTYNKLIEISGFYSGEYEDDSLLGYAVV